MTIKYRTFAIALAAGPLWLVAAMNIVQAQPQARLAISPERYQVEFDARGGDTESLMLKNLSSETITVQLSVSNWDLDQDNKVRVIPPQEDSLDQWLVVNPLQVTIPPDTPQTIRWAILPRTEPIPGEYRAIIFIEEVLPEREPSKVTSVRMKMRFGIPVYGQVGKPTEVTKVTAVVTDSSGQNVAIKVSNEGNQHARLGGSYGVWSKAAFPGKERALAQMRRFNSKEDTFSVKKLNEIVLLPDNSRTLTIEPELPAVGDFIVQFDASFGSTPLHNTISVRRAD